jgi:hypothetical protein
VSTTAMTPLPLSLVGDTTSLDFVVRVGPSDLSLVPSSSSAEAVPVLVATAAASDPFSANPRAGQNVSQQYTVSFVGRKSSKRYLRRTARAAANFAGPIGSQRY